MKDEELIKKAKGYAKDSSLPEDVRETLWMVASIAKDRTSELRFLVGQLESFAHHVVRSAEMSGLREQKQG